MAEVDHPALFKTETVDHLVKWLQTVALNLLRRVLYREQPTEDDLFPPDQCSLFERLAEPRTRRGLTFLIRRPYSRVVEKTARSRKPSYSAWRNRVVDEIERLLNVSSLYHLPEDIWPVIETRAWRDPVFLREVSLYIETRLRRRVLFGLNEFITIQLHPRTFWILVVMACIHTRPDKGRLFNLFTRILKRWWPQDHRVLWFAPDPEKQWHRHIRTLGERHGLRNNHWACVWDQWLLLEALAHWSSDRYPKSLERALLDLPIRQYDPADPARDQTGLDSISAVRIRLAHPEWQQGIPGWFDTLVRQTLHDLNDSYARRARQKQEKGWRRYLAAVWHILRHRTVKDSV